MSCVFPLEEAVMMIILFFVEAESRFIVRPFTYRIFDSSVCIVPRVFLQEETRGPCQPLRQRAPPAKMPREVEAHPKLCQRPKGEGQSRGETNGEEDEGRDAWTRERESVNWS